LATKTSMSIMFSIANPYMPFMPFYALLHPGSPSGS
jgi:hypothetical protein